MAFCSPWPAAADSLPLFGAGGVAQNATGQELHDAEHGHRRGAFGQHAQSKKLVDYVTARSAITLADIQPEPSRPREQPAGRRRRFWRRRDWVRSSGDVVRIACSSRFFECVDRTEWSSHEVPVKPRSEIIKVVAVGKTSSPVNGGLSDHDLVIAF